MNTAKTCLSSKAECLNIPREWLPTSPISHTYYPSHAHSKCHCDRGMMSNRALGDDVTLQVVRAICHPVVRWEWGGVTRLFAWSPGARQERWGEIFLGALSSRPFDADSTNIVNYKSIKTCKDIFICIHIYSISHKSNRFYCHITTAHVPWWVKFLRACSRQCRNNLHIDCTYLQTYTDDNVQNTHTYLSTHIVLLEIITVRHTQYTLYTVCTHSILYTHSNMQRCNRLYISYAMSWMCIWTTRFLYLCSVCV